MPLASLIQARRASAAPLHLRGLSRCLSRRHLLKAWGAASLQLVGTNLLEMTLAAQGGQDFPPSSPLPWVQEA